MTVAHFLDVCFTILLTLLTLCYTWLTIPKAHATPTNSNVHVGSQCYHGYIYVLVLFQEVFHQSQSPKGEFEGITLVSDPADF